jgi:hypothetical protein
MRRPPRETIVKSGVAEVARWLLDAGKGGIDGVNVGPQVATLVGAGTGGLLPATRSFCAAEARVFADSVLIVADASVLRGGGSDGSGGPTAMVIADDKVSLEFIGAKTLP